MTSKAATSRKIDDAVSGLEVVALELPGFWSSAQSVEEEKRCHVRTVRDESFLGPGATYVPPAQQPKQRRGYEENRALDELQ